MIKIINILLWVMAVLAVAMLFFQVYNIGWFKGYDQSMWDRKKIVCEDLQVSELPAWCLQYLGK